MAQTSTLRLPTADEWYAQQIEDIELQAIDAGVTVPPTAKGSDFDLRARSLANALAVLTANQVIQDADGNPFTAEGAQLEEIRIGDGLLEVPASQATGKISVKSTALAAITVSDGTQLMCPGALPGKIVGTHTGVVTGSELNFTVTKAGAAGNLVAGTIVRFSSPPPGLSPEGTVVTTMTDGSDVETDSKKRRRIVNRRQYPPKNGNPTHLREIALSATNAIDNAFVYPALGLPSSCLVAVTAPWFNGGTGQSRVATAGATVAISGSIEAAANTDSELYAVAATSNEYVDVRLLLDVAPGNSSWTDLVPWPSVSTTVSTVVSNTSFRVVASSVIVAPAVGKTIAIWSVADLGFRTAVVQTVSAVTSSSWDVTISAWQGGSVTVVSGLQVSPGAGNMSAWGDSLLEIFGEQTPGEACATWQEPRALRSPAESNSEPTGFGSRELGSFIDAFDELRDVQIDTINVSTPTRTTPAAAPNVLCLRSVSLGVL
jgi:hypothetical protein